MKIGYFRFTESNNYIIPEDKLEDFTELRETIDIFVDNGEAPYELWDEMLDKYGDYVIEGDLEDRKILIEE